MGTKRVLVVDDETSVAWVVREALEEHGYQVDTAFDGLAALDKVRSFEPAAVILDVMFPEENGYRVSRAIKTQDGVHTPATIPKVLLMTARRLDDDLEREDMFRRFSMADDLLYKPFRLEELLDRVRALIG